MEQKITDIRSRGEIVGPNAKILFWVFFVQSLANYMVDAKLALISTLGLILSLVCTAATIYALWRMSAASDSFRIAAAVGVASLILSLCSALLAHFTMLVLVLSVISTIITLYGTYHEFKGFSQVLADVDQKKSSDWQSLWRSFLAIQICALLILLFAAWIPFIGGLLALVIAIGGLILIIWRLMLLYSTAKLFQS